MASIKKRGNGIYQITVSNGYDIYGKKIREYKTVEFPSNMSEKEQEYEIRKIADEFEHKVKTGNYLDGEKITLAEFIEIWLKEYAEKEYRPSTLKVYKTRINTRIIPSLGHLKMARIQPHHIIKFYNMLAKEGIRNDVLYIPKRKLIKAMEQKEDKRKAVQLMEISRQTYHRLLGGNKTNTDTAMKIAYYYGVQVKDIFTEYGDGKLSANTIRHHHVLLSSIMTTAVHWQVIESNPVRRVKPPESAPADFDFYDEDKLAKLCVALENEPMKYRTIVYLVLDTGLRLSETMGIDWDMINFEDQMLHIDRQRQYISGYGIIEGDPKTKHGERDIALSDHTIYILKQLKKEQAVNRLKLGEKYHQSNKVFVHEDGSEIFPLRPSVWWKKFLERHNLPHITFHELRHTNATLLIANGMDAVTLAGRLGHGDKTVTLNTYTHAIKSKNKQAASIMDDVLSRAKGE